MNLDIENGLFIICGATSGFGLSITRALLAEKARVIAIARTKENLEAMATRQGNQFEVLATDITQSSSIGRLEQIIGSRKIDGIVMNASGPPAKTFMETTLEDWDTAYHQLLRWKIELTMRLLPLFQKDGYGRFVFIESATIKQPIENLILSSAFRLSVAGFVKTISREIPEKGITFNILAPGFHTTPAMERLIIKKCNDLGISRAAAKKELEKNIPMGKPGDPDMFASLALWLLSPFSAYVTGQVFVADGGMISAVL
jgi:3-oxoacyl-[acyl-carrier protein] reductase